MLVFIHLECDNLSKLIGNEHLVYKLKHLPKNTYFSMLMLSRPQEARGTSS